MSHRDELKCLIVAEHLYHPVINLNPFSWVLVAREILCARMKHDIAVLINKTGEQPTHFPKVQGQYVDTDRLE